MTPELFLRVGVEPALSLLPGEMNTREAKAMILAIAFQESKLSYRRQFGGPARSYVQFEKFGGVKGVLTHTATTDHMTRVCAELDIPATMSGVYTAMEWNDVLACVCARLLLWTLPTSLPACGEHEKGWRQYLQAWRPGKPRPSAWESNFQQAWTVIQS